MTQGLTSEKQGFSHAPSTPNHASADVRCLSASSLPSQPSSPNCSNVCESHSRQYTSARPSSAKQREPGWEPAIERIKKSKLPLNVEPTELDPSTPTQQIRLKQRAATLIQQYAGSKWQAAQRTKWMLDVVCRIDCDYRGCILEQARMIHHLQRQIQQMQDSNADSFSQAQNRMQELEALAQHQQSQLMECTATILDLKARLADGEAALLAAHQAAEITANEVSHLQQAACSMSEHDTRSRKLMANRAHELKEALRHAQAKLRHSNDAGRKHNLEVTALLQLKEEEMAHEKARLSSHYLSQIAAIHQVERAAAQVEVAKVRMELDAYKEPWTYAYGKRSPTRDPDMTKSLGLIPSSRNTLAPAV